MQFFHIVNRGVDKRKVFLDNQDHWRFIHDLYEFNDTAQVVDNLYYRFSTHNTIIRDIGCREFDDRGRERLVNLYAFCLMPNHYHLLLSERVEGGIPRFMKKVNMGYSKYFNERYTRSGALWQGKYRKHHVLEDVHFQWLPFYIHLNPLDLTRHDWRTRSIVDIGQAATYLSKYRWSSHLDYLGTRNIPSVTQRTTLLDVLGGNTGYQKRFDKLLKDVQSMPLDVVTFE